MGTACGDIIGTVYEGHKTKQIDFPPPLFCSRSRLTDDTVVSSECKALQNTFLTKLQK